MSDQFTKWEKVALILLGISLLIIITVIVTGTIGNFVSGEGWNIFDGVHIHKVLIAWLIIGAGLGLIYERKELDWVSIALIIIGSVIWLYDIVIWVMPWGITLA